MSKSLHWLLAIFIPALILILFYFISENMNIRNTEKVCTYVSIGTCVQENNRKDTIKNIDLKKYNVDSSSHKVGDRIVYDVVTADEKRSRNLLIVSILCFILIFFIRYPFLWYIFIIGI